MTETKNASAKPADDFIRLQDLWGMFVLRWKWFALSLAVTLGIALLYLLSTPNVYTRSASILVKDDDKGSSMSNAMSEFSDMGLFTANSNIHNELQTIQSPELMTEVVERLGLDETYTVRQGLKRIELYKISPVSVTFLDSPNAPVSFSIDLKGNGYFTIKDLEVAGEEMDGTYTVASGDSIQTPAGRMVLTDTAQYTDSLWADKHIRYTKGDPDRVSDAYTAKLRAELSSKEATIINLSIDDASIRKAEDILNMLILVYNENWIRDKNRIAISTSQFIGDRLDVIENELGHVDENISSYKSQHLLPDVQAASSLYMSQSAQNKKQLLELNNQLSTAEYIRRKLNGKRIDQQLPANSGLEISTIEGQISEYNKAVLDRNRLIANSSEKNPLVADLSNSLQSMKRTILQSVDNLIVSLKTEIRSIRKEEELNTSQLASNPNQAKYLLSVERQQKVKEQLYLYLLQKREENELSQAFTAYNTRVITASRGSMAPTAPRKMNILLVAFALGLLIPSGAIFLLENMNTKVRGRKDLEHLSIPFIGEIPYYEQDKRSRLLDRYLPKKMQKQRKDVKTPVLVKEGSRNIINEAFRVLRSNIDFMTAGDNHQRVIIITSFNPASGKSFLILNIAISFALKRNKVLLIDGDMRHAFTSTNVGKPEKGLSDYLSRRTDHWQELLVKIPGHEGLDVLPVGTIPPNPTELLEEGCLKQLVEEARGIYDYVFIDCPPIDIVADTQIIEQLADCTIFVVRAGLLERSMLADLESIYKEKRFKNMSMILNGTQAVGHRYGYGYGYHSGYYNGYYGSSSSYYSKE